MVLCRLIATGIVVRLLYKLYYYKQPKPIFGVYKQGSIWFPFKYTLFLTIFYWRVLIARYWRKEVTKPIPEVLDCAQPLVGHIKAFDAVFFIGAKDGYYFTMGAERRPHGVINGIFYLVVPGKGLLCGSKVPDTILLDAKENKFSAEGLVITPVEPMRKWKLRYKGEMWLKSDPSVTFYVKFSADWSSKFDYFNYDTDLHPKCLARAIAREEWTKEYFDTLNLCHQSRYEQMGQAVVQIDLDGVKMEVTTPSFRDHGYGGRRDWSLMHRYAFFHIFLDDGKMAAIGVVSQPCTVSEMETGYLYESNGTIHPIEWCDFRLYQHGEGGRPPSDHAFQFKAGGVVFRTQVVVQYENTHYVGWNWEARMVERFVRYSVNGIPGQGVSEFHYRHWDGRPAYLNAEDPQWFQVLREKYIYS